MAQQVLHRTANGLIANRNPLFAEEGSLVVAENVVCDREGVLSNRRGYSRYSLVDADALGEYQGKLVILSGSTLYIDNGTGTLIALSGSYTPLPGGRMRFCEAGNSLYFTTTKGVMKLDSLTGTVRKAGMPAGLDTQLAKNGVGTWFTSNTAVGYRVLWVRVDASGKEISGEPSWRVTISNSGSADGVTVVSTIPSEVIAGDYCEIYRTELSASSSTDPGDELFLITRIAVTSYDITNRYITYQDNLDPYFLGQPLYTNASEDGNLQAHSVPPLCHDVCLYRGYMNYAGETSKEHRVYLQLQATAGITAETDSITILIGTTPLTYTFSASESIPNHKFKLFTGGILSQDIRNTMESLCTVVNRDTSNTLVNCFYSSTIDDPSGKITIKAKDVGSDPIYITATAGCALKFSPTIPTSGTSLKSENLYFKNRMYFSRFEAYDHVPEGTNWDDFGSSNNDIVRIHALTTSLIVMKEDGVWRRTGDDDVNFYDLPLDPSVSLVCRDAPCVLDNNVYCVALEGICKISDSGVSIISWPIDLALKRIFSFNNWKAISFATEYHSDFKYIFFTPENNSDTYCKIAWVWNHLTSKWTMWRKSVKCGYVSSVTDRLYLGHAVDGYLLEERKSWNTSLDDYKDESIPVTITSISSKTIELTYNYSVPLTEGFALENPSVGQSSSITSVLSLGGTAYRVTITDELPALKTGAAFVSLPITSIVYWKPETCGNPAVSKHWITTQHYFEDMGATHFDVGFYTDIINTVKWYNKTL